MECLRHPTLFILLHNIYSWIITYLALISTISSIYIFYICIHFFHFHERRSQCSIIFSIIFITWIVFFAVRFTRDTSAVCVRWFWLGPRKQQRKSWSVSMQNKISYYRILAARSNQICWTNILSLFERALGIVVGKSNLTDILWREERPALACSCVQETRYIAYHSWLFL
jgi:hypothetical protein